VPRTALLGSALVAGVLLATGVLAGCSPDTPVAVSRVPGTGAATTAPGPTAGAVPTVLPTPVAAGTVGRVPGPFDDRLALTGTRLDADGVHTRVTVTSDVSDILALEVTAAFYDSHGRLLGSGRVVRGEQHDATGSHVPDESLDLVVPAAPAYAARTASAVLTVPVLVNE
jgi:hypothetical protein